MKMEEKKHFFNRPLNIIVIAMICTALWGSAFPAVKSGYELFQIDSGDTAETLLFAGMRFGMAGVLVWIYKIMSQKKIQLPDKKTIPMIVKLGIVQTVVQYYFLYVGLAHTTGVVGSILTGTASFITVLFSHFFLQGDKLSRNKVIGCLLGLAGVILTQMGQEQGASGFALHGEGFVLLSATSFAFSSIMIKQMSAKVDSMSLTGGQLLVGGGILMTLGLANGGRFSHVSSKGILLLLYLACVSAVAFTLWTLLLQYNAVSKISVYDFLVPVFGGMMSAAVLKENILDIHYLTALVLVSLGILIVNGTTSKTCDS